MTKTNRYVRLIGCLILVVLLLTPASYADTDNPIDHWMQTVEESFLNQRYIDMDGAYLGQCVDIAFFYAAEIFPEYNFRDTIGLGNANQLFWSASSDFFEAIPFDGTAPKAGDIIMWDNWAGGHVGVIFDTADGTAKLYEQNTNMMGTAPITIRELTGPNYGLEYMSYQPIGYLRPRADVLGIKEIKPATKVVTEQLD